jgi:small subunit ribosomal protein S13
MARIKGIDLPKDKKGKIGLTYIFGIGHTLANQILKESEVDPDTRVRDWDDDQLTRIREVINNNYRTEGELRGEVQTNIKRLTDIGCYRGVRHRKSLPANGQRTRTNARTRKGRKHTVANKKKAVK